MSIWKTKAKILPIYTMIIVETELRFKKPWEGLGTNTESILLASVLTIQTISEVIVFIILWNKDLALAQFTKCGIRCVAYGAGKGHRRGNT